MIFFIEERTREFMLVLMRKPDGVQLRNFEMARVRFSSLIPLFLLIFTSSAWSSEALWIDVRTANEYSQGHVPGAIHIPYEEITERIGEVTQDKDALIYLYCRSGRRSGIALETLSEAGFTNAINIGGLEDAQRIAAKTGEK